MGKHLIIGSFLLCLGLAVWQFIARDTRTLRENIEQAPSHKRPRIILEQFHLRQYLGKQQVSDLQAIYADFSAPNKANVSGDISGWQLRDNERESLRAQSLVAYFDSRNLTDLIDAGQLRSASLRGFVAFSFRGHTLYTDEANYDPVSKRISGEDPVRVVGPKRWMQGENGFMVKMDEQSLEMFGQVKGVFYPHAEH